MFRSYVKLHGFMDHTFMADTSWIIVHGCHDHRSTVHSPARVITKKKHPKTWANFGAAALTFGADALTVTACSHRSGNKTSLCVLNLERSSSPLCFVFVFLVCVFVLLVLVMHVSVFPVLVFVLFVLVLLNVCFLYLCVCFLYLCFLYLWLLYLCVLYLCYLYLCFLYVCFLYLSGVHLRCACDCMHLQLTCPCASCTCVSCLVSIVLMFLVIVF